ncbi:MAG: DUF397 domain-containing protein [Umezawaea sp.]
MDCSGLSWRKSSFSGSGAGSNCLEFAADDSLALVRNSRNKNSEILAFPRARWSAFLRFARGFAVSAKPYPRGSR